MFCRADASPEARPGGPVQRPAEIAAALHVSTETVRRCAEAGRIPYFETPGGHRRYVLEDVKHALAMERARKFEQPVEDEDEGRLAANETDVRPIVRVARRNAPAPRDAFPDEVVSNVVNPIERAVKRAREQDADNVFSSVIWTGLRWTPGKPYCSLVFLTDPALRAQHGLAAEQLELMLERLREALSHFMGEDGSVYSVVANAHDATDVPASVLLEHCELTLDLGAATT